MSTRTRRDFTAVWVGVVAFVGTAIIGGMWTGLLAINLAISPAIPWAVVIMGALLWALFRYLGGAWAPRSTAETRRRWLRANPITGDVLGWALAAGLLSIIALAGLWIVLFQVAHISGRAIPDFSKYPILSVALVLIMASLVNAVAEEALFRGYFQGILERKIGGAAAIGVTLLVMAPEHALTQGFVWPTLVFYAAVDLMLGLIAYLTQSIIPAIAVHAVGLLAFFTLVWPGDMLRQFIGGGDGASWLWIHTAQVIVFAALAAVAFVRLASLRRPRGVSPSDAALA